MICESSHAHHKVLVITKYCPSQARLCISRTCKITRMWKPCLLILTGKWYKILMNYTRCLMCKQRYHLKQQRHFWIVLQWLWTMDFCIVATSNFLNKSPVSQKEDWKHIPTSSWGQSSLRMHMVASTAPVIYLFLKVWCSLSGAAHSSSQDISQIQCTCRLQKLNSFPACSLFHSFWPFSHTNPRT